jgi:ferritin-like metal-binding protein YciE
LRDRINQLQSDTDLRREAAVVASNDAEIRDRVNALTDRMVVAEGLAGQMGQLAERITATDVTARQAAEHVAALEQRVDSVGTELANQLSELGRDIDGLAQHTSEIAGGSVSDEVLDALRSGQIRLANEQARYEIAFRQDLAALAEHVRRSPR